MTQPMPHDILTLEADTLHDHAKALCRILIDSVAAGAAISFMAPLSADDAAAFWLHDVAPKLRAKHRQLYAARQQGQIVGTVQLLTAMPPNQPHRCEIAKMIVHPDARRLGFGRALMTHALVQAAAMGKSLVTLDTRTGDAAEPLYTAMGFQVAGIIPDYAYDPDGNARHATTLMFRYL
jgi:ribosomal protein S18 acetylase RimI-like enzyme